MREPIHPYGGYEHMGCRCGGCTVPASLPAMSARKQVPRRRNRPKDVTSTVALVTVYMTRRRGHDGFDQETVPVVDELGTVQKIVGRWPRLRFAYHVRTRSGRITYGWIETLKLACGHTKTVWQRRVRCWTTHTRCGKCPRTVAASPRGASTS